MCVLWLNILLVDSCSHRQGPESFYLSPTRRNIPYSALTTMYTPLEEMFYSCGYVRYCIVLEIYGPVMELKLYLIITLQKEDDVSRKKKIIGS